jgi:hypothetical protein
VVIGIGIICYINKFKEKQTEMIALIVTIFGILLSVSDEFCCQYDYEPKKIWKAIQNDLVNNNEIRIIDLVENDSICQKIFFVVDNTQSTESTKIEIDNNKKNKLNSLIAKINSSGFEADLEKLNEKTKTIKLSELLKIHLYSILIDLQKSKSKFTIIKFDESPEFMSNNIDKDFTDENLKIAFNSIKEIDFKGKHTNFKTLFDFIETKANGNDNPFQKDKNTLVFLSDFIHDSQNSQDNNPDSINAVLNKLDQKSIHFNVIGISNITKPANFISIKEKVEEILPERYKTFDVLNEGIIKLEFSNHNCEKPLYFYTTNRLHEDKAQCCLTFIGTSNKDYRFRLKNNHNARQFYQIVNGTDTTKLTEYPIFQQLNKDNKIYIIMKGHIVGQSFTPTLFVEDLTANYSYSIGIVFFKELSKTSKILGSILLGMLIGFGFKNKIKRLFQKLGNYLKQPTALTMAQKK